MAYQANYLVRTQQILVATYKQVKSLYYYNKNRNNGIHICKLTNNSFAVWQKV